MKVDSAVDGNCPGGCDRAIEPATSARARVFEVHMQSGERLGLAAFPADAAVGRSVGRTVRSGVRIGGKPTVLRLVGPACSNSVLSANGRHANSPSPHRLAANLSTVVARLNTTPQSRVNFLNQT